LPPDLLLTIICIGTAFTADTKCLDLSARLVKRLRDRIFEVSLSPLSVGYLLIVSEWRKIPA